MSTTVVDDLSGRHDRPVPAPTTPVGAGRVGFGDVVRFEWTKFRSARVTLWTLVATGLVLPLFAVIVAVTGSLQPDDTILGGSLTGAGGAQLFAAAVGALTMTTEYTSGMVRATFTASPRRVRVLAAKAAVLAISVVLVTLVASLAALFVGVVMLDGDRYATGDPFPALLGVAVSLSLAGVLGLAVGTVLRRSTGAIAAVAGLILLPSSFAPFLGDHQRWLGGASPMAALEKLTQTSNATHETVGSLGGWPSLAVVAAGTAVLLAASAWQLLARDA